MIGFFIGSAFVFSSAMLGFMYNLNPCQWLFVSILSGLGGQIIYAGMGN